MGNTLPSPKTEKVTCQGNILTLEKDASLEFPIHDHRRSRSHYRQHRGQTKKGSLQKAQAINNHHEANGSSVAQIEYSLCTCQGWRIYQEDAYFCKNHFTRISRDSQLQQEKIKAEQGDCRTKMMLEEHAVFGILDGHGGDYASKFVKEHFYSVFCKQSEYHDYCDLFLDVHPLFDDDQEIRTKKERTSMSKNTVNADKKRKKITEEEFCTRSMQLLELALEKTFVQLDCLMLLSVKELQELKKETEPSKGWKMTENGYDLMDTGTAVLIVLITPHLIICANAGDCRAVLLCRGNNDKNCCDKKCAVKEHDKIEMNDFEVIPLSVDHKPYLPLEEERIIKAGASVSGGKIDGILSLSRALGDFNFKAQNKILETVITKSTCSESHLHTPQALANNRDLAIASVEHVVSQSPEITIKKRDNGKDLYLIGASDGIWDVISNEECADIVSSVFKEGESDMGLVTEEIIDICLKKGSRDNMTVLVVKFPLQKIGCGGGVLKRRKRRLGTM